MDFLKTRLLDTLSDQIRKIQKVSKSLLGRKSEFEGKARKRSWGPRWTLAQWEPG